MARDTQAGRNALGIRYFTKGPAALISRLNEILKGMNALFIRPSGDIVAEVTPDGTLLRFRDRSASSYAVTPPAPWTMRGSSDGGTLVIYFTPALVNNFVPKIGSTFIDDPTPPGLTVTGSAGVTYARATLDGAGAITDLIIDSAASLPSDTTSGTIYKYRRIGTWTASGGVFTAVNTILNTNQTFYSCGGTPIWE